LAFRREVDLEREVARPFDDELVSIESSPILEHPEWLRVHGRASWTAIDVRRVAVVEAFLANAVGERALPLALENFLLNRLELFRCFRQSLFELVEKQALAARYSIHRAF